MANYFGIGGQLDRKGHESGTRAAEVNKHCQCHYVSDILKVLETLLHRSLIAGNVANSGEDSWCIGTAAICGARVYFRIDDKLGCQREKHSGHTQPYVHRVAQSNGHRASGQDHHISQLFDKTALTFIIGTKMFVLLDRHWSQFWRIALSLIVGQDADHFFAVSAASDLNHRVCWIVVDLDSGE